MEAFFQTVIGVLMANFITAWFAYAMWRLKKNEGDLVAIFIALMCLASAGVAWLSLDAQSIAANNG